MKLSKHQRHMKLNPERKMGSQDQPSVVQVMGRSVVVYSLHVSRLRVEFALRFVEGLMFTNWKFATTKIPGSLAGWPGRFSEPY
jgi:hypothetical protein